MVRTLRHGGRLAAVAIGVAVTLAWAAGVAAADTWVAEEELLVSRINAERAEAGLATLTVDPGLTGVARAWSAQMASDDHLRHNPLRHEQVSGEHSGLAENVGYSSWPGATPTQMAEQVHRAFVQSAPHRANILGDHNRVGVGVVITPSDKLWVTVNFTSRPSAPTVQADPQIDEAVAVSGQLFSAAGAGAGRPAAYAVVARAEVFGDALGGAGLAGDAAPLLLTPGPTGADPDPGVDPRTRAELDRVLGGRGTVYLLGGAGAVSERAAGELAGAGYDVRRLAGPSRVETAVRVAEEVLARHGSGGGVLLARADDWADAVTGGAYAAASGSPVLLTGRDELHPAVAAFLAEHAWTRRWALGGRVALSDEVVAAAGAERVAGPDRTATAVAIAERLWGRTAGADGDRYLATPGYAGAGWAYALVHAPWSAAHNAPQLLVADGEVPPSVAGYLGALGYGHDVHGEVQAASAVPAGVVERLRDLVAQAAKR